MLQNASETSNQKQCYKAHQKRPIRNNVTKCVRKVQSETMLQSASEMSNQKQCYKTDNVYTDDINFYGIKLGSSN